VYLRGQYLVHGINSLLIYVSFEVAFSKNNFGFDTAIAKCFQVYWFYYFQKRLQVDLSSYVERTHQQVYDPMAYEEKKLAAQLKHKQAVEDAYGPGSYISGSAMSFCSCVILYIFK
jgi:hypothetical protein